MSQGNRVASGKRLASDLKHIREQQGISVQEMHEETKISIALIESFENSGLFEHPMFNKVYLRSFVRTYADQVGVDVKEALDALERAMDGQYKGGLVEGKPDEAAAGSDGAAEGDRPAEEASRLHDDAAQPLAAGAAGSTGRGSDDLDAGHDAPEDLSDEQTEERAAEPSSAAGTSEPIAAGGGHSTLTGKRRKSRRNEGLSRLTVIAGAAIIIIVAALVFFVLRPGAADDEQVAEEPNVAEVDTVEQDEDPAVEERPRADISLGELLHFTVIAEGGPVRGIRIIRDSDLRRPYWIDQGQATVYPARQRIVLEQQLENIRLLLEGYNYPTEQRDAQGRIVITREDAQAFADTVRGEPYPLTVQPDTNQVPSP